MRLAALIIVLLTIVASGCASKRVMKDCEHLDGPFWECKEP